MVKQLLSVVLLVAGTLVPAGAEVEGIRDQGFQAATAPVQSPGACSGGVVYDDGTFENGYRTTSVFATHFVQQMHPADIDPLVEAARLETVCICWQTLGSSSAVFDIVVWDSDGPGGAPRSELGRIAASASGIPFGLDGRFYTYDLSSLGITTARPVYVGPVWDSGTYDELYLCGDESPSTPRATAYGDTGLFAGILPPDEKVETGASDFRALGIRADFDTSGKYCAPTDDALCLGDDRFEVSVEWRTPDGDTGIGVPVTETVDSGMFWFFNSRNLEMLLKVLNGCPVNDRFWVYFAATTDVEFQVTVQDKRTDTTKTYTNPQGQPANAVTDGNAFETCGVE